MFRRRAVTWGLFLWALVFSYTWLTYIDASSQLRMIPIAINILACTILVPLLARDASNMKSVLLALCWSIVISLGVLLRTLDVIDGIALNIHISVMTGIVTLVWCIMSHAEHVTEGGFHWYVWFLLVTLSLCTAFNSQTQEARLVYVVAASISFVVHCFYVLHVLRIQSVGSERCQHIFRVVSCFMLITTILINAILIQSDIITYQHWQELILVAEVVIAVIIVIDSVIGFSHQPIKQEYAPLSAHDVI